MFKFEQGLFTELIVVIKAGVTLFEKLTLLNNQRTWLLVLYSIEDFRVNGKLRSFLIRIGQCIEGRSEGRDWHDI